MVDALTVQKVWPVGRDAVDALLTAAAAGHGGALVVSGPAGIGKTTLLRTALRGAGVELTVTGCPAESGLPFAGLHRLFAGTGAAPPHCEGDRLAAGLATLAVLRGLAARGPVVCLIDDASWLDRPSLDALALAARRVGAERVALVFAVRDTPAGGTGDCLAGLPHRRLAPLDLRASRDLLAGSVPDLAGDVAGVLAGMAGGNPRALVELAGALHAEQRRGEAAPPVTLPDDSLLRREYRTALRALPTATRRVLMLAAAAALTTGEAEDGDGDGAAPGCWAAPGCGAALLLAAGHRPEDLAPAERADLVVVDGDRVRFGPPLFASVLYAEATLAERHAAHHRLAELTGGLANALHRAAVAGGKDDVLARELAAAGSTAPPRARATALRLAAALTTDPGEAAGRTVAAAGLAWRAGLPHRARLLLRPAFGAGVPQRTHAARELLLGVIELRTGATGDAQHTLLTAAGRLAARDREGSLGALMLAGEALCATGRHDRFSELARDALRLRRPAEPVLVEMQFEHFTGVSAAFSGQPERARGALRRVLDLAAGIDDPPALVRAASAGILIGDDSQAHRLALRAARLARGTGDRATVPPALAYAATAALALGDLDVAVATGTEAVRLADATGQDAVADNCCGLLAVVAGMLGDAGTCRQWVRRCRARAGADVDSQARAMCVWAMSLLDVAEGRPAEAAGRLWGVMRTAVGRGHLGVQVPATPTLVEAMVRCGDQTLVREVLDAYDVWAVSTANPTWLALSARCHALLAGDEDEADARFGAALRLHLAGDSAFARARTELLYGEELRRRRRPAAAREHLRGALATFEQFDAAPWVRRAAAELRAAGDHVTPTGEGDPALTAQQSRIAQLVADGATNREVAAALFLSPRTVDHHLRNIFTRLGVRSRTELARVLS